MIDFIIKSTISLGILYLVYILVLSKLKTFKFNRFFLLGSLVFSIVIPFISIPFENSVVPVIATTGIQTITESIEQSGEMIVVGNYVQLQSTNWLFCIYTTVSFILLIRFGLNLSNISNTIRTNPNQKHQNNLFVLVNEKVLPHTFFGYVMLNKDDYDSGRIDNALIQHEVAHCKQWHSIDIVFIELLRVLLWINPFVWLFKKPIQLNHEYLADGFVLNHHETRNYQSVLINTVLRNSSGFLASNFNFSLTKQRLKMMTKQFSPTQAILGKITSILALLLITITFSCSQEDAIEYNLSSNSQNTWWQPILKAHNIEPTAYNNFDRIFEMGSKNSITDGIVTLEDACIIFKIRDGYSILKSPVAYHDLNSKTVTASKATVDSFLLTKTDDFSSGKLVNHQILEGLELQFEEKIRWKADRMESNPMWTIDLY